ncbi:MAG: prolyl oligopeptidase family serine peptidase [Prevotellaceae bacterium]|nr:prolyl oligopeptidase family serine peptidase [Prevotellaceae bacterium]
MKKRFSFFISFCLILLNSNCTISGQDNAELLKEIKRLQSSINNQKHTHDEIIKKIDDVLWYTKVGDIAYIDKVFMSGPPRWKEKSETAEGSGNPVKFWSYVFIPKSADENKKYPLIVYAHGGVHGDMSTYNAHIIRELIAQEYIVVAADYRGSIGYGRTSYENIDYGGLENQDVYASRNYMVENYKFVDKRRIGIMGWSHGGMITLMNLFQYPNDYKVGFAGVPVSDVIARLGYKNPDYAEYFSNDYHIGKTVNEDIKEYRRRSPVWHVDKLQTPLLIHTNTNDEDVNVLEVEHMINALKAANKKFEYKIFENIPGGHSFDRMDQKSATDIRFTIHKFLENHLNPNKPFKSVDDMRKAAYRFN